MGKWNSTWTGNVNTLIKLKVPVDKQFPGIQKFTADIDDAEELSDALLEIKEKAEALAKERDKKAAELKSLVTSLKSRLNGYDSTREQLKRVMEKDDNKEGKEALNGLGVGMNRIEGLLKDPAALKFDIEVR